MNSYTLTASVWNQKPLTRDFSALDDAEAMMDSIPYIMDKAFKDKKGPWAVGHIELRDQDFNLVHHMDAKA